MDYALNKILGALPADTKVYPGHEYTKSNVKFSNTVLQNPDLSKLTEKANSTEVLTGMYTIGDEKKFNPFMRLQDPQVIKATNSSTEVEAMARLRELKNKL
ncbi:unnamed protein product [Kuraishia capsulata CBS 1993]|uniref:Hydroxyacylglutathione hydrolase C-terminal domain-containing protein n=1 Tax=Kuraishia capsulata CBS 1993 TaxID=1382522 RepID=W6MTP5_9ASCO|nr:uncharacterized protein KUCA_T00005837001 [Kuraishia capsulata CBS 1993]CDK29843.1 unnamed protein product [Kuraishia capsulata CBS 1993]